MAWLIKYFYMFVLLLNPSSKGELMMDSEKSEKLSSGSVYLDNPCMKDIPPPNPGMPPGATLPPHEHHIKWTPYKDEKCLAIFTNVLEPYEGARAFCRGRHSANLVSIDFRDKQTFLEKFLNSTTIVDNIWIGLRHKSDGIYEWLDGTNFGYNNWVSDSPKKNSSYCVQMHAIEAGGYGKWSETPCAKKNLVLCERNQPWSNARLQTMVINQRKNPVPLGFIYVQLPKEISPLEMWPWMVWKDISSKYAGVFFRVDGTSASRFGTVQEESYPKIRGASAVADVRNIYPTSIIVSPNNVWSNYLYVGDEASKTFRYIGIKLDQSTEEVRPRNMAIRIWKRTE